MFVNGRKHVFKTLETVFDKKQPTIWMHCASLGEYEQGVPVMEALKNKYPGYRLLVTFFSPSGYEIKKNSQLADVVVYLPLDTKINARRFVELVNPTLALFVKYEFWPNYFKELRNNKTTIILISAVFRKEQAFFKWYGGIMREALQKVDHFFVQDRISKELIAKIGFMSKTTLSGDTRFDRVSYQLQMDNKVSFLKTFVDHRKCVVIGSSWPEDEVLFTSFINNASKDICFIIAPHEISKAGVQELKNKLLKKTIAFSEKDNQSLAEYEVFILDTIGYLSRAYSYATIGYVGGAMGSSGLHNILEPATFGIPIVIGKNFEKFREAKQLQELKGLYSVATPEAFTAVMNKLIDNEDFRKQTGVIAGDFIQHNTGATGIIMEYVEYCLGKL